MTSAQQPNDRPVARPRPVGLLSPSGRRRVALGVAALAMLPIGLVAACGNATLKQRDDTRPEPNASSEAARQVYPSAAPAGALPTASPNPGSGGDVSQPQLDPPTNGSLPR